MPAHWLSFAQEALADRLLVVVLAALLMPLWSAPLRKLLGVHRLAAVFDQFLHQAERKLNRSQRNAATRVYRGMVVLVAACALLLMASWAVALLVAHWHYGVYVEIAVLSLLLPAWYVLRRARRVVRLLAADRDDDARIALQRLKTKLDLLGDHQWRQIQKHHGI